MTKLYILGKTDANYGVNERGYESYVSDSPFGAIYDCYHVFVIQAETESEARLIASDSKGDEGEDAWLNPKWSYCRELVPDGKSGVVISDFHAG